MTLLPQRFALAPGVVIFAALVPPTAAGTITSATSYVNCIYQAEGAPSQQQTETVQGASLALSCDTMNTSGQAVGSVETTLEWPLLADVMGSVTGSASFEGEAWIEFWVAVDQFATPPTNVDSVPVVMTDSGDTSVDGSGGATASVEFPSSGPEYNVPVVEQLSLTPGDAIAGSIDAFCWTDTYPSGSGECQALVDPVFQLDQATFDTQMGGNTFPLASYYDLELSPDVGVPEPASVALIGAGMLGLGYAVRKTESCARK
jgi:hypothetical protein